MTNGKSSGDSKPETPTPADQESDAKAKASVTSGDKPPAKELTKEEQMALYEDDLKENDWGHQPC